MRAGVNVTKVVVTSVLSHAHLLVPGRSTSMSATQPRLCARERARRPERERVRPLADVRVRNIRLTVEARAVPWIRYSTMREEPPARSDAIRWKMPVSEVGFGTS